MDSFSARSFYCLSCVPANVAGTAFREKYNPGLKALTVEEETTESRLFLGGGNSASNREMKNTFPFIFLQMCPAGADHCRGGPVGAPGEFFPSRSPGLCGVDSPSRHQGALYRPFVRAGRHRALPAPLLAAPHFRSLAEAGPGPEAWRGRGRGRRTPSRPGGPSPRPIEPGPTGEDFSFLGPASKPVRPSPRPPQVTAMGLPPPRRTPKPRGPRPRSLFSSP